MKQVGSTVEMMPLPGRGIGRDQLRFDLAFPELDVLMLQPRGVDVVQTVRGTADEAATLVGDGTVHALDQIAFQQHIVIEKQAIRCIDLGQQKGAVPPCRGAAGASRFAQADPSRS
jgi:hypothetical protein